MIKLDIGGGKNKRDEDYISVDKVNGDVIADMWALPYEENEVDEIWSSHCLEHAPMSKVIDTLKEWLRVLKPGGRLIVQVPNFDYIARYWLVGPDRAWAERMIFGMQDSDHEFHKCAFTTLSLRGDLEGVGFTVKNVEMRLAYNQETIQAVCTKPLKADN